MLKKHFCVIFVIYDVIYVLIYNLDNCTLLVKLTLLFLSHHPEKTCNLKKKIKKKKRYIF